DDYFTGSDGVYRFDPAGLPEAHARCQQLAEAGLAAGRTVVVDNTNVCAEHCAVYAAMALRHGVPWTVMYPGSGATADLAELERRTVHGVPADSLARMAQNWEPHEVFVQRVQVLAEALLAQAVA